MPAFFRYCFTIGPPLNTVIKLIKSFTLWTNSILNEIIVLVETKVLFNEVQCLWNDIGKIKENFSLHHFPYTSKEQFQKLVA